MRAEDRRKLLKGSIAAAAVLASGVPALSAPRQGGRLRVAVAASDSGATERAFPGVTDFARTITVGAVYDTLTEIAANGALQGELAVAWQAERSAQSWVVTLRDEVRFHDGTEFTAADVLASFTRVQTAPSSGTGHKILEQIVGMRALSDHRLRFDLTAPDPDFPYRLSDPDLVILPVAWTGASAELAPGTGIYRLRRYAPGSRLLAARVGDHYKADCAGFFEEIEVLGLTTAQARLEALRSGRVDVASEIYAGLKTGLGLRPRGGRVIVPSARRLVVLGQDNVAPLLRELDAEALVARALGEAGRVLSRGLDAGLGDRTARPETATILSGPSEPERRVAAALARQLLRAGVRPVPVAADKRADITVRQTAAAPTPPPASEWLQIGLDHVIAHAPNVRPPDRIGGSWPVDDGRLAERWSFA